MLIRCRRHSFGSESQFRCRTHNSVTNFNSLQTTQLWQRIIISVQNTRFDSECEFAADNSVLAANHNFAAKHTIRQRINNSVSTANHKFAADNSVSAANANSLQPTQFRQRISISLQNTQFGSKC